MTTVREGIRHPGRWLRDICGGESAFPLVVLEAMALGVPVVSTRLGASGIGAADGTEILLADGPESLGDACVSLLLDRDLAVTIGRAGRRRGV